MLECLILGDSLAVGVGQVRSECVTFAQRSVVLAGCGLNVLRSA
jgi:hypothetical protein